MYIDASGRTVLQGVKEIHDFKMKMARLRENRKLHGRTSFQNIPISIENRKGSVRKGTDDSGEEWRTKMKLPYGYIPGTEGVDGDALDVFVGPDEHAAFAYVVHCNTPDGKRFDEDKVMLGFQSSEAAKRCFLQHYDSDKFFGGIDAIPMWKFRERAFVKKYTTKKLVASVRRAREGAWLQQPPSFFERAETLGRGTDQQMRKDILGKNLMPSPQVREAREHGVKGQKWGIHKPRDAGSARTNQQKDMQQQLQNDPHTLNMMQVISRTQPQLNMIAQAQRNRAIQQTAQQMKSGQAPAPKTKEQHNKELKHEHGEALDHLKELGWKVLEIGSRLSGTEGIVNAIHSIVASPEGKKMFMSSNDKGSHRLSTPRKPRMRRAHASRTFESRMGSFLNESGTKGMKWGVRKRKEKNSIVDEMVRQNKDNGLGSNSGSRWKIQPNDPMRWGSYKGQNFENHAVGTSKYPRVSELMDNALRGSNSRVDNKSYVSELLSMQDYLEKHESSMKEIENSLGHWSRRDIVTLAVEGGDETRKLSGKYGKSEVSKIAAFMNRAWDAKHDGKYDEHDSSSRELGDKAKSVIDKLENFGYKLSGKTHYGFIELTKPGKGQYSGQTMNIHVDPQTGERRGGLIDDKGRNEGEKGYKGPKLSESFRESRKTYFARSMSHYGTDAEESSLDLIKESFPNESVSYPKTKRHAELGMGYFHKKIDAAKRLVLKPAKVRRLTAGVFSEATHALKNKIPVYAIRKGKLRRVKKVEALRHPNKSGHFGKIIFKKKSKSL
jgi:hypothetical protein